MIGRLAEVAALPSPRLSLGLFCDAGQFVLIWKTDYYEGWGAGAERSEGSAAPTPYVVWC
jgi:hypothetical protein